jgi:hypothetical protein
VAAQGKPFYFSLFQLAALQQLLIGAPGHRLQRKWRIILAEGAFTSRLRSRWGRWRSMHRSIGLVLPPKLQLCIEFKPYWLPAPSMTLDAMDPSHDNQVFLTIGNLFSCQSPAGASHPCRRRAWLSASSASSSVGPTVESSSSAANSSRDSMTSTGQWALWRHRRV